MFQVSPTPYIYKSTCRYDGRTGDGSVGLIRASAAGRCHAGLSAGRVFHPGGQDRRLAQMSLKVVQLDRTYTLNPSPSEAAQLDRNPRTNDMLVCGSGRHPIATIASI